MIELIINIDSYTNQKNYSNPAFFKYAYTTAPSSDQKDIMNDARKIFISEAFKGLKKGCWASMVHIYALSNALNIQIQQLYPIEMENNSFLKSLKYLASSCLIKPFGYNNEITRKDIYFLP